MDKQITKYYLYINWTAQETSGLCFDVFNQDNKGVEHNRVSTVHYPYPCLIDTYLDQDGNGVERRVYTVLK